MILLNELGRVAESTAAYVLMVRDGRLITPPFSEGALEEHHRRRPRSTLRLARHRLRASAVDHTKLYVADEIGLTELTEITLVQAVDDREPAGEPTILSALLKRYRAAVTGARAILRSSSRFCRSLRRHGAR